MDTQQAPAVAGPSNAGARQIPVRAPYPRQLIIYDPNTAEWNPVDDSTTQGKDLIIATNYLAVSYRQYDFPDRNKLEEDVRKICEKYELVAYWLDFACTGKTQEEKNEDLYRIADVFRGSKATLIMIPDGAADGWKSWGGRVWTFPEALLSKKLLVKDGKKWVQEKTLLQVANVAYKGTEDQERLISIYDSGGKDFARFRDRFEDLCRGLWSRTSGPGASIPKDPQYTAWPGERVYALMGFLQRRIEPKQHETLKEAFDRLLEANGLECDNYPWETDKVFGVRDKAKTGAREIDRIPLHHVQSAKYSDSGCVVQNSCDKQTRLQIRGVIENWLKSDTGGEENERIFYLYGPPGTGKSTIARTVAESCDNNNTLAATFFCSRDSAECRDIRNIFCTISYQLCHLYSPFRTTVLEEIEREEKLHKAHIDVQLNKLIVGPIKKSLVKGTVNRYVIIIDALDECEDDRRNDTSTSIVLSALSKFIADLAPLKFVITSRPEENIHGVLLHSPDLKSFTKAYNLGADSETESDIRHYLLNSFRLTQGDDIRLFDTKIDALVERSNGIFLIASTAVNFLKDRPDSEEQLQQLLDDKVPLSATNRYGSLDHLYIQILEAKFADASPLLLYRLKRALALLITALEPLKIIDMKKSLFDMDVVEVFDDLHSLVSIPKKNNGDEAVRFRHPSIQDFLLDEKRSTNRYVINNTFKYVRSAIYSDSRCAVKDSCVRGTRVDILDAIENWLTNEDAECERVFWISGFSGTGKSAIARTVAEFCDDGGTLAATFFCSRDSSECSDIRNIFCTISHQLCRYDPFKMKVADNVTNDQDLFYAQIDTQLKKLIVEPLKALRGAGIPLDRYVIVIDALDECEDDWVPDTSTSLVLSALGKYLDDLAPLKFLVTSRPEEYILCCFRTLGLSHHSKSRDLTYELQTDIDILLYLRSRFYILGSANQPWPSEGELDALVEKASGLFIFASTAVIFLLDKDVGEREGQLRTLLNSKAPSSSSVYAHLDQLYNQILNDKVKKVEDSLLHRLRKAFAILLSAEERVTIDLLEGLLPNTSVGELFHDLRSLVSIPEMRNDHIRFKHSSVQDFLKDEKRCTNRFVIRRPINLLTECCAVKLIQCVEDGTDVRKLLERARTFESSDQKEKDAIGYASYHIGDHLKQFCIDDLKEANEIIFNERLIMLLLAKDMKDWVKTTLLKFLTEDSLSREVCLKLYSYTLVLLNFKVYNAESLPSLDGDNETSQLLKAKERLAAKYPDVPAFKIKAKEFVHVESLLFYVQLNFREVSELSDEITEMYHILGSQVQLGKTRSSEFNVIAKIFADEIRISQSQSLMYSPLGEVSERYNSESTKSEWMSVKLILKRYKDLLYYCLDGDGHSLLYLYEAAFARIRRQSSIQGSDDMHDLFRAIVGIGHNGCGADSMSFFFSSASVHLSAYLLPLDTLQLLCFIQYSFSDFIVTDVSDMNHKEIHDSTGTANIISLECTSYKEMLLRHKQYEDNPKYEHISQRLILNHSALVKLAKEAPSDLVTEEVQISVYENSFNNLMARWCMLKAKAILQELDGKSCHHSMSGLPCIDLQSSLKMLKDDRAAMYAMRSWHHFVSECASNLNGSGLQLRLQDILSHGSTLYYATPQETRQIIGRAIEWMVEYLLSREPAVSGKLMQLLFESAILFSLQNWIDGKTYYWMVDREMLREKYSYNDGLYELEEKGNDVRVTLLAYKIGYMKNLENTNDPGLTEKALNVRKLAKAAHDTIMKGRVPEDKQVRSTIKNYMRELDRILKKNRRLLFIGGDSEDKGVQNTGPDDSEFEQNALYERMVLSLEVNACSAAIKIFIRRLDEILGPIESNNDSETNAEAELAVDDDEDIVPSIGVSKDAGDSVDAEVATARIEEIEEAHVDAELGVTNHQGQVVGTTSDANMEHSLAVALRENRILREQLRRQTVLLRSYATLMPTTAVTDEQIRTPEDSAEMTLASHSSESSITNQIN